VRRNVARARSLFLVLLVGVLFSGGCGAAKGSLVGSAGKAIYAWVAGALGLGGSETDPAEESAPGAEEGGVLEAVTHALGGDDEASEAEEGGGFWRYSEPNGTLRFVQSFDEVPIGSRATAERIETARRPAANAGREPRREPRLAARRPLPQPEAAPARHSDVVIYTTPTCGWCRKTLAWLDARGVDYVNKDVQSNPEYAEELYRLTGSGSVPVVDVDGELVRGYDTRSLEELL
jgi:glutaredoxin